MCGRGKEDHRGRRRSLGFGTHVLDLMNDLAGDPKSCSAELRIKGKLVQKQDIQEKETKDWVLLAGDEVHARWKMKTVGILLLTVFVGMG